MYQKSCTCSKGFSDGFCKREIQTNYPHNDDDLDDDVSRMKQP